MIDLDEFRAVMSESGVDGPTRRSLIWLAERINRSVEDRDRQDAYAKAMEGYPG